MSHQLIAELARLRHKEALANSEERQRISKEMRRIRALDLLRRAIELGLRNGLPAEDLMREISMTLKRACSS